MDFREFFNSGQSLDAEVRKETMNACLQTIKGHREEILGCLEQDLGLMKPVCLLYYHALVERPLRLAAGMAGHVLRPSCAVSRAPYIISLAKTYYSPIGLVLIDPDFRMPFLHAYGIFLVSLAVGNCTVFRFSGKKSATAVLLTGLINDSIPNGFGRIIFSDEECPIEVPDLTLGGLDFTPDAGTVPTGRALAVFDAGSELNWSALKVVMAWKKSGSLTEIAPEAVLIPFAVRDRFIKNLDKWHWRKCGTEAPEKIPVIGYQDNDDLWRHLEQEGHPAALFVFCSNSILKERLIADIPFAAGCVNGAFMRAPDFKEMRHRLMKEKTLTI